ncbi:MAG: RNA-binding protein [Deltaproteobacteria bacterium]|nr:RNA-binding protein [Deltaproteobacteria bacterium]
MNIYVGNLSYDTTDQELLNTFSTFGQVKSAKVITDMGTGRSKGFGFVEMEQAADAREAIAALNGTELSGRSITVNEARPREDRGPRTGGGNSRGGHRGW